MKANHNGLWKNSLKAVVVVNISNSKNESKSQRSMVLKFQLYCCGKYQ